MLFYFTGTGNSLYAAKHLDAERSSIPQVMRGPQLEFTADAIGIVCPIFGHEAPPMVKEFLEKGTFRTDYFYMILTYGNRQGGAAELARDMLEQRGIHPAYLNTLLMVDNFLPGFDMEKQVKLDKKVEEQIAAIRADIETEVSPIVGSEKQSEEMIHYLLQEFEGDTAKIWQSNIFGKSFHELVSEDLNGKLKRMPEDARYKLQETLQRIINEGSGGLICIIL